MDDELNNVHRIEIARIMRDAKGKDLEPPKKKKKKKPPKSTGVSFRGDVSQGENSVIAGGDVSQTITNNYGKRPKRTSLSFTPGPEHITSAQAKKIKDKVDQLVDIQVQGGKSTAKAYSHTWSKFNNNFGLPGYRELKKGKYKRALDWLNQQLAIASNQTGHWAREREDRTPARKPAASPMNTLYKRIWTNSKKRGMSKDDVYALVLEHRGKRVPSLKQLAYDDLEWLASVLAPSRR